MEGLEDEMSEEEAGSENERGEDSKASGGGKKQKGKQSGSKRKLAVCAYVCVCVCVHVCGYTCACMRVCACFFLKGGVGKTLARLWLAVGYSLWPLAHAPLVAPSAYTTAPGCPPRPYALRCKGV